MVTPKQIDFSSCGGGDNSDDTLSHRESPRNPSSKRAAASFAAEAGEETMKKKKKKKKKNLGPPLIVRIWNEEDELSILKVFYSSSPLHFDLVLHSDFLKTRFEISQGLVDYRAKTGFNPKIDWDAFYSFLGSSIVAKFSKEQVLSKIRKLKRRFHVHWEKISEGNDPKFTRSSDSEAFGFSSMIWGQGEFGNDDGMDKEMVKEHEVNGNGAAENGTARIAQENESVEEMLKEHEEMLNENGAEEIRDNNGTARKAQQLESESEEEMLKEHEEPFHVNGAENIRDNNETTQIAQQSESEEEMLKEHEEVANTELLNENGTAKTTENGTTGGKERHDDDDDDELCAVQDAFEAIMSQGLSGYQKKLQLEKLMNLGTGKRRELSDEWKALCVEERRLNIKKLRFSAKLAEAANDS